jgi:hypothetical protein
MKEPPASWGWNLLLAVFVVGAIGNLILTIINLWRTSNDRPHHQRPRAGIEREGDGGALH